MSALLWQYFFDDDVENFRKVLAAAIRNIGSQISRPGGGTRSVSGGLSTSPGARSNIKKTLEPSKQHTQALRPNAKALTTISIGRADLNWSDRRGVTLLHEIASSQGGDASEFAAALLEHPLLDLYIQDEESGWTALHRALYFGNVTIAQRLLKRDIHDSITHSAPGAPHNAGGLIKIKDREGNSPFDVYGASITDRSILHSSSIPLLGERSDDEDGELAQGVSGDANEGGTSKSIPARTQVFGDELYAFGSNKNFTLGFGDEDDRQFPERIHLIRPDHLLSRLYNDHFENAHLPHPKRNSQSISAPRISQLPGIIKYQQIIMQDVQLSKLHSAVLTADPESNLFICGFGSGGRLGLGDEVTRFDFSCVNAGAIAGKKIIDVALGQDHTIAITSLGETFTWGSNFYGQLGYASNLRSSGHKEDIPPQLHPRQVYGPLKKEPVIGAAASRIHSVVFTPVSLYTFGSNEGQLGIVDSDARSLVSQVAPRKVAASLFSSTIHSVSAIDKATICLLDSHEVWIFANFGYNKMVFPFEGFSNYFLKTTTTLRNTRMPIATSRTNYISKITSGGDTVCAMSSMGDVFTVHVSQKLETSAASTSTTNPSKIRGALSAPHRVWSIKKDRMAVRDVDVGQDGSVIICTDSGSVWRRVKRAKIKDANAAAFSEYKPKDYKFLRVPRLTNIKAVRSNAFGGFAAIRRDCDVLQTQIEVFSNTIWQDLHPLLPFYGFGEEDSDTEQPEPRFWRPSQQNDVASIRRAVLISTALEEEIATFLTPKHGTLTNEVKVGTTMSEVRIPVHEFMLSARSEVLRSAFSKFKAAYYFSIPDVLTIEYDKDGRVVLLFQGLDFITIFNLVLYVYTDAVVDVWHHTKTSPQSAYRYRSIRVELMKVAAQLNVKRLEQAARVMSEPPKTMQHDFGFAIQDDSFFHNGDLEIELSGGSLKVHSALMCQRCPFFEGLFHGRAAGRWLASRRELIDDPTEAIKVDLKHVEPKTFNYVLRYLYADTDETMFDDIVTADLDSFLDLILDVLSVANELMLDRLAQCCQKMIGQYVNTRNVCSLLNTIAPCSVTDFKEAALEYICQNLEGMLENHLLGELEPDIMLELDEKVQENQTEAFPIARNHEAYAEMLDDHPELRESLEHHRKVKIDMVSLQNRLFEREAKSNAATKARAELLEDFEARPSQNKSRRKPSGEQDTELRSPRLTPQKSTTDLMFQMDDPLDSEAHKHSPYSTSILSKRPPTPGSKSPLLSASLQSDGFSSSPGSRYHPDQSPSSPYESALGMTSDTPPSLGVALHTPPINRDEATPWSSAQLSLPKSDMKNIMAQASSDRSSQLSSGLVTRGKGKGQETSGNSPSASRMSQRERKKKQHQQQESSVQPENYKEAGLEGPFKKPTSPWQTVSKAPKVDLQDALKGEVGKSVEPQETPRSASPMTLRQTVSGKQSQSRRAASGPLTSSSKPRPVEQQQPAGVTASSKTPPKFDRANSTLSESALKAPSIQSIRHIPAATAEPSLQLSMADILAQQQTEKQVIKDAVAKRSLQEIQQEQAFQEWWDQESARTQLEAQEAERERAQVASAKKDRGQRRGRGGSRGRPSGRSNEHGKGKERDMAQKDNGHDQSKNIAPTSSSGQRERQKQ